MNSNSYNDESTHDRQLPTEMLPKAPKKIIRRVVKKISNQNTINNNPNTINNPWSTSTTQSTHPMSQSTATFQNDSKTTIKELDILVVNKDQFYSPQFYSRFRECVQILSKSMFTFHTIQNPPHIKYISSLFKSPSSTKIQQQLQSTHQVFTCDPDRNIRYSKLPTFSTSICSYLKDSEQFSSLTISDFFTNTLLLQYLQSSLTIEAKQSLYKPNIATNAPNLYYISHHPHPTLGIDELSYWYFRLQSCSNVYSQLISNTNQPLIESLPMQQPQTLTKLLGVYFTEGLQSFQQFPTCLQNQNLYSTFLAETQHMYHRHKGININISLSMNILKCLTSLPAEMFISSHCSYCFDILMMKINHNNLCLCSPESKLLFSTQLNAITSCIKRGIYDTYLAALHLYNESKESCTKIIGFMATQEQQDVMSIYASYVPNDLFEREKHERGN